MKFEMDKTKKEGTLRFEGDQSIFTIEKIKKEMIKALGKSSKLVLDFEKATSFDLSFIQLVYATLKTAQKENKQLVIAESYPASWTKAILDSGYSHHPWFGIS